MSPHVPGFGASALVLSVLCGCGVDVQDGVGPRVPIPNVQGAVMRVASPARGLEVDLRTDVGQAVASTTTDRSGGFGFAVAGPGAWEIKVSGGAAGDFESVTRGFVFDGVGPLALPVVDVHTHGAAVLEPGDGASAPTPTLTQPLIFRWTLPDLPGAAARVQLYDAAGSPVWFSNALESDQVPWNGLGNQEGRQGQPVSPGTFTWRVKFELPDSSEARTAMRRLELT